MVTGNFTRLSAGRVEFCANSVQTFSTPSFSFEKVVRARGLEPLSLAAPDPKSGVSAIPPRARAGSFIKKIRRIKPPVAQNLDFTLRARLHAAARWFNFGAMRFLSRTIFLTLALGGSLLLAGCSPMNDNSPDDEKEPHFMLGKNRVNAMDYSGARDAFEEALEVNPHSAAAHFQLACLFDTKISDPAAAIYHYQEFLQLDPKSENADVIRERINTCKQQLASDVLQLPSASAAQQQVEKLAEQNRQLQSQIDHLNDVIKQWNVYYASQLAKTNLPAQNNFGAQIPTTQTPDDISSPAANPTSQPAPQKIKPRTYVVVRGDTFAGIARKFSVSVFALQAANPNITPKKLRANSILNLPPP
jgi:LysM repeat protein